MVAIGNERARDYRATYERHGPNMAYGTVEQELFMALSDLAYCQFGNCAVYHNELMKLTGAFCDGKKLPTMPFALDI